MIHQTIALRPDYGRAGAVEPERPATLATYVLDSRPADPEGTRRPALLICPGGGYRRTSSREGEPIALRFNALGFSAFILSYSCAPSPYPTALTELAAAVSMIRERAEEWGIDPGAVFVGGFSAGGHLAASLGTLWNKEIPQGPRAPGKTFTLAEAGKTRTIRPDGLILSYPVISSGMFAHQESFQNLLGDRLGELRDFMALENRVDGDTPPTFLWHTWEDQAVPAENAMLFAMALRGAGIPFELHVYEPGRHGLSAATEETMSEEGWGVQRECQGWIDLAATWMNNR